jgi:hypothetical protein
MRIQAIVGLALIAALALVAPSAISVEAAAPPVRQDDTAKKERRKREKQRREGNLVDEQGTVTQITNDMFGIVPDFDKGTRFLPSNLTAEFKQDGLRVVFSGKVGEIPPNVRLPGTPLTLSGIRRLEAGQ